MTSIASRAAPPRHARAEGPRLPTMAELNRATAHTAATIKDPESTVHDVHRAAEMEAATLHAFEQRHGNQAGTDLERYREAEACA